MNFAVAIIGAIVSAGAFFWWRSEVGSFLGAKGEEAALRCLLKVGTGDCQSLWFVGLHQTNQIASALFYGGLLAVLYGILAPSGKSDTDDRPKPIRRDPPHF